MKKDKENPLWDKIQDDARPAWAPDFLRMGYAIMWKRDSLVDLLIKLGIRNPEIAKEERGGLQRMKGNSRVLYFDDVWVVAIQPRFRPFYAPSMKLAPREWWMEAQTRTPPKIASYIAPGESEVMNGSQRLADVVASILKTPNGYPRTLPGVDMDPVLREVTNMAAPPKVMENEGVNPAGDSSGLAQGGRSITRYNQ